MNKLVEKELTEKFKILLDKNANFARPLSEFWKGCSVKECCLVGIYGIWFSAEGSSCISKQNIVDYYNDFVHPDVRKFLKDNNMYLSWYDCSTPIILFK
jgi:hypothetical protein